MPYQTVWSHVIQTIAEALKGGKNPPIKEVLGNLDPQILQESESSPPPSDIIGKGYGPPTRMEGKYEYAKPFNPPTGIEEMGSQYAPTNPYGATPSDQQEVIRKNYEQDSFGLEGLRKEFMNEGLPTGGDQLLQNDMNLPSYKGLNIDAFNMKLLQEEMRKQMNRPPGNQGWR